MQHCPNDPDLHRYHAGELHESQEAWVRRHLALCEACARRDAKIVQEHADLVQRLRRRIPVGDDAHDRHRDTEAGPVQAETESMPSGPVAQPPTQLLAPDPLPPRGIPDYEPIQFIGRGGFGHVWLARQRLTGALYALKVIPRGEAGAIELGGVRLHKERCRGRPHLMTIEHVGETPDAFYYVMELADDARGSGLHDPAGYQPMTLSEECQRRGRLPVAEAVGIALHILDGLAGLHAAGLLHRDVKPANVMLHQGRWKLGDLGLLTDHSRTEVGGCTPDYAPPGGVHDRAGDLYCLGRVLNELVWGKAHCDDPSAGGDPMHAAAERLRPILARACHDTPEKRYQSAAEMSAALHAVLPKPPRRVPPIGMAAAVVVVAVGLLGWWVGHDHPPTGGAVAAAAEPEIAVFFKRSQDDHFDHKLSPGQLPLETGFLLRTEVTLPEPAYPYLYLLFSDEPPVRQYPDSVAESARVGSFACPVLSADPGEQDYLRLAPPVGTGAYLLLLADEPVTDLAALDETMNGVRLTAADDPHTLWIGDPADPQPLRATDRGVEPELVKARRGAVRVLDGDVLSRFPRKRVVAFPYVEAESSNSGGS